MSRAKSYTLGAWIKLWYEVYAEPRLREKTKDYYLNYIDNHIIPELGNTPLEKLTTIQIQKFYNDLQKSGRIQRYTHIKLKDKGLSTRVVRGIHTLLNNCLEQAVAERLLLTNPAKGCRLPKLEKREMKILPEDKIGPYLAEAERRGLLAAFYLELTTGLRRGELLALLWTDLDVENMTISVSKQVNRINGELVVQPAQDAQLHPQAGYPAEGGGAAGRGARKAPTQSLPVRVAQDRHHVRLGLLPPHP